MEEEEKAQDQPASQQPGHVTPAAKPTKLRAQVTELTTNMNAVMRAIVEIRDALVNQKDHLNAERQRVETRQTQKRHDLRLEMEAKLAKQHAETKKMFQQLSWLKCRLLKGSNPPLPLYQHQL